MSQATTSSAGDVVDQIEGWLNSVYSDFRGFFFGTKTSSSSVLPTPTLPPARTSANGVVATQTASEAISGLLAQSTALASPSAATNTLKARPTLTDTASARQTHEITTSLSEQFSKTLSSSVASATPTSSAIPEPGQHKTSNINMQTLAFAALGALIVILVYLLTPIAVRLFQFSVNATKLLFRRSGSFSKDSEMGLTSDSFSLTGNIENEDQREGLDKKSKLRILWYMLRFGESFDEARLRFVLRQFAQNGIGPEGQPLDPKYVTFDPGDGAADQH